MRLWLVRHGPTHQTVMTGWRDVRADLSDGAAVARLSAYLPQAPVVASDLLRARQTADAIASGRPRLPDEPGLREFDFGQWDGLSFDAVAARDPDLSRAFWEVPGDIAPPGGESWNTVAARVRSTLLRLAGAHPALIAVGHIGMIMTAIGQSRRMTPVQAMGQKIDTLSVTEMTLRDDGWELGRINHIA